MKRQHDDESGISLIELIVYVLLSSIIVVSTAMILVNSWTTQRDVTSTTEATNRGQAMGSTIERAIRNALDFEVSTDGTELRVRTSLTGTLRCQGFLLVDGTARMTISSGALPTAATGWPLWDTGVARDGVTPYFSATGQQIAYAFKITTDSAPVRITGEASTRSTPTGVSSPCW